MPPVVVRAPPMPKTRPIWPRIFSRGARLAEVGRTSVPAAAPWPNVFGRGVSGSPMITTLTTQSVWALPHIPTCPADNTPRSPLQHRGERGQHGERARADTALVVEVVRRLVQVELGALLHVVRIATTEAAAVHLERLARQLLVRCKPGRRCRWPPRAKQHLSHMLHDTLADWPNLAELSS